MKNYLISVITVAICSSLVGYIVTEDDGGGIGKNLRMVGAICLILAIVLPLSPVLGDIGNISDKLESALEILKFGGTDMSDTEEYAKLFNYQLINSSISEAQNILNDLICQKFSIEKDDCYVEISVSNGSKEDISIEKVIVTLKDQALWKDPYAIEEYIRNMLECDCIVRSSN